MNELIVRNVSFQGTKLLAIQDKKSGRVFTGINVVLRGLGFDDSQVRYRRDKWLEDKVISLRGAKIFTPLREWWNSRNVLCGYSKVAISVGKD